MLGRLVAAGLLCIHVLLVGWIDWWTSPNTTEAGHMGATVYFWHTFRYDVFCVNPPLSRIVSGLPVALCHPKYDWSGYSPRPQDRSEWKIGTAFIDANSAEKLHWCFALGRWALIPLLIAGGYSGYRLSGEMYGKSAALVFLTLWAFSPLLLGWGATICPDALAADLGMCAIYALRRWFVRPGWMRAALAGICLGLLPLAKLTWIVGFGLWPALWAIWTTSAWIRKSGPETIALPPFRQLATVLILGLYTLNMGYLFDGTFRPLGKLVFISQLFRGPAASEYQQTPAADNRFSGMWLGIIPVPLPADFVQGIDIQRYDFERGSPSYLRGEWADHGWWYYYLYALAIKVPLGTWCLVMLAIGASIFCREYSASWRDELLVLVPFVVILIVVSSQTGFSLHSRYILPALPFLFVWASKVGRVFEMRLFTRNRLVMAAAVALALTWSVASSLAVYPHSLSYFNELAAVLSTPADALYPKPRSDTQKRSVWAILVSWPSAGPCNGPRHLLSSNIDCGQDLFYLEDWYESHPEGRPIHVAYNGTYPLDHSRIKSAGDPPLGLGGGNNKMAHATFGPLPGWYALSVAEIYSRSQRYRYFLNFNPVAMAGYSIYIYHVTTDEANRVRRELGLPELPKDWRGWS